MSSKKSRKISNRLIFGFGAVVLLTIILGLSAVCSVIILGDTNSDVYDHPFTVSKAIGEINSGILAIHRTMKDVVLSQNTQDIDEEAALVDNYEADVYKAFDVVAERFLGDKSDVINARKAFEDWRPIRQEVIDLARSGQTQAAAEITRGRGVRHIDMMNELVGKMRKFANDKAVTFLEKSKRTRNITLASICVIVFAAIFAAAAIAIKIAGSIIKPLSLISTDIKKISGGSLDHKITLDTDDEISALAAAFNDMIDRLKATTASRNELDRVNSKLASEVVTRQQTSEELAKEKEQLHITLAAIGDGVIATDGSGRVLMINPVAQKLTGYSEQEAFGKRLEEVFNIINYDTRLKVDNPVEKVLNTGRIVGLANHTVLISKEGSEYQVADSASPIRDSSGRTVGVVLVFRDVTQEYEQNRQIYERTERQRLAADAGGMGMWDWDIHKGVIVIDDNWKSIVNWSGSGYELSIEQLMSHIHPEDTNLVKLSIEECMIGESNSYDETFRFSADHDNWIWIRSAGRVMGWDTGGKPVRMMGITQDITERRNMEMSLAREKENLKITLNSIGDGVITTDVEGRVMRINPVAQHLTGWNQWEAQDRSIEEVFNVIDETTRQPSESIVLKALESPAFTGLKNSKILLGRLGGEYHISSSAAPIKDKDGNIEGVVVVFKNVTEDYLRQKAYQEKTQYLKIAIDAAGVGLWQWDIRTGHFSVDDNWKAMFGWKGENEFHINDAIVNVHQDDSRQVRKGIEDCLCGKTDYYDSIFRYKTDEGKHLWVRSLGRVVERDAKDRPVKFMGVNVDITELKQSQLDLFREKENARITLNSIGDGVIATDDKGCVVSFNPAAEKMTGWKQADAQGKQLEDVFNIVSSQTGKKAANPVVQVLKTGKIVGLTNHTALISRDGTKYQISDSAAPIVDKDGNVSGVVLVFSDVTQEYRNRQRLFEESQRMRLASQAACIGIWDWNIKTGKMVVDDVWKQMLNWQQSSDEVIAEDIIAMIHPDDVGSVRAKIEECLKSKNGDYQASFRLRTKSDGELVWINAVGKVMERDDAGQPLRFVGVNYNITELAKAKAALEIEKENLSITLHSIGDGVISTDMEGRIVQLNPVSEALTGWTLKQAKGKKLEEVFNIINAVTGKKAENPVDKVLKTGKIVGLANHTALISRNGEKYQIADSAAPIIDSEGNVRGVVLVFRDVTEEYRQRQLLFEETERRRLAVDAAKIGIWDWDIKNGSFVVDDGWVRMLNWKGPKTMMVKEILTVVHPDDVADVQGAMETCTNGSSKDFNCVFRFNLPLNVKWILTLGRAVEFDEKGLPTRILGVNQDITRFKDIELKLRESEERFRAMFDNSPLMIALLNKKLKPEFLNKGYEKLGYSLEELTQISSSHITHPDYRKINEANYKKLLSGQTDNFVLEKKYICKDGSTVDVEIIAVAIKDEQGQLRYILTMATDITRRNRILEDLRRSNQELEQFAYVASHDLREPLRTIGLYVEFLEKQYGELFDQDASTYMQFIISGVKRMNALIQGLLEYSRTGAADIESADVDMDEVVDIVKANLKFSIIHNDAEIESKDLGVVRGDKMQLVQLFQNIISNAIRFKSPHRKPKIVISTKKQGARRLFKISDNGIGVEKEYYDRIFNIFSRLNSKDEYEGSGIGLAVAKRIVERHDGKIWLESKPGKGTSFYFTIGTKVELL